VISWIASLERERERYDPGNHTNSHEIGSEQESIYETRGRY
jgi:hypothetical protein